MTTNKIDDLRAALFAQIDKLAQAENPAAEIERSKAMADLAQVVINSAKVEVDYLKVIDSRSPSTFLEPGKDDVPGITGRTVHRIR